MSEQVFDREKGYQTTMSLARSLYEKGLITAEELLAIDTMMLEKYHPSLGSLYPLKYAELT